MAEISEFSSFNWRAHRSKSDIALATLSEIKEAANRRHLSSDVAQSI
jgi:hypothetical protein